MLLNANRTVNMMHSKHWVWKKTTMKLVMIRDLFIFKVESLRVLLHVLHPFCNAIHFYTCS